MLEADVEAAVREKSYASMQDIDAVVLEGDGRLSVIATRGTTRPLLVKIASPQ